MQILRQPFGEQSARCLQLEHDGEILHFNVGYASNIGTGLKGEVQPNGRDFNRLVRDVNGYWATLSSDIQNSIFDRYKVMRKLFEEVVDIERLLVLLRREMNKLLALHPYDDVERYIKHKGTVKYPTDLKLEYGIGAPESPLTYLRPDYESLMAFKVLVRVALPIMGEFIQRTSRLIDTNQKEIITCRLFSSTQLTQTVPYQKLQLYMETYVQDEKMTMAALMGGMGTAQLPEWLLALTIVRRVAIIELPAKDEPDEPRNLVREIYNYVKSCVENPDKRFGGPIKPKSVESTAGRADDDNTSGAELIKISEKASEGQVVNYSVFVSDPYRLALATDPTIPMKLVRACVTEMGFNETYSRNAAQTALTQWVLSRKLNPRAVLVLEHAESRLAVATAQALLWHWGFHNLAAIVAGLPVKIPDNTFVGVDTGNLTKEQIEAALREYPYFQIPRDRKWSKVNVDTLPQANLLHLALQGNTLRSCVGQLAGLLCETGWDLRCPKELGALVTLDYRQGLGYMVGKTLKSDLADLALKVKSTYKIRNA